MTQWSSDIAHRDRTGWLGISDSNYRIRPRATQLDLRDNFAGGRRKSGGGDSFAYELRGAYGRAFTNRVPGDGDSRPSDLTEVALAEPVG